MLDYGQDSVNIFKTFPTATLGEQSFKGPRCQETKGVKGASSRQKTPTKRSKDPSTVVNTPKGGEDRYNYEELMETLGNINRDVLKQGAEIEEMKLVILSQQVQISKLKKMVLRLVQKKKRKHYVLKKRGAGETSVEKEKEIGAKSVKEAVIEPATVTSKEVERTPAAVTTAAAETELSREEIEIAETLVKAKLDTPKATSKAKGVVIKEVETEKKRKELSVAKIKKKGKEKMIESEKPSKKQTQIELDEEMAKKLQE
ncbi:hypothetical protein L6452_26166 [Arctium lappa]|uniref:Uncharacterized protein n=1 Tax=Arctium lappa TaxID=4217 RepID=A0ACB9AGJ0_ARCLA|nr:hypothetical protein L6452_26166 [Arctium lappa]